MINQSLEKSAKECEVKFKVALVEKQITQRKLAAKLGTTPQQVNRAIKGDTSPMSKKLGRRCKKPWVLLTK